MTDCIIMQPIARCGVALLEEAGISVLEAGSLDPAALRQHLATARAVITRNHGFSAEAIKAAPKLELIASHGTGTDAIDQKAAALRRIRVVNTPGANADSVAEHALALIFACARCVPAGDHAVRIGDWSFRDRARPREIAKSGLGLIGYGHVARRLAALAGGLGMTVFVHSNHVDETDLAELDALGGRSVARLDDLLAMSEIVSLHGLPGRAPVLDAARLSGMRADSILINTARGALIDEAALARALVERRIAAAALDVFSDEPLPPDSPLLDCPNLILTPHMGGTGIAAMERTALAVARAVLDGLGITPPA